MTDTTIGNAVRRPNKTAYSHDSDRVRHHADDYPTPRGFVLPLLRYLKLPRSTVVWEPAAGGGHMVAVLREHFDTVLFSDLHYSQHDFLTAPWPGEAAPSWVITNPPYKHAEVFVRRALDLVPYVAMLMNTAFLEGVGRSAGLFQEYPPSRILMVNRRMRMPNGVSSTFSHVWMVWGKSQTTIFDWLLADKAEGLQMPTGQAEGVWQ